jgi:hypothetical protein
VVALASADNTDCEPTSRTATRRSRHGIAQRAAADVEDTVVIGGAQVVDAPLILSQNATDDGQALRFGTPTERIGPESVIARCKRSVHG